MFHPDSWHHSHLLQPWYPLAVSHTIYVIFFHHPHSVFPTSSFTYYPNHLTNYISTTVSPEQASTLVHHPLMPVSPGLLYPTNPGFCPHQGLSCPSSPGFYHPTQLLDLDFVLPQQACESGILLGLVSRDIDVDVESFTFLLLFSCGFLLSISCVPFFFSFFFFFFFFFFLPNASFSPPFT